MKGDSEKKEKIKYSKKLKDKGGHKGSNILIKEIFFGWREIYA